MELYKKIRDKYGRKDLTHERISNLSRWIAAHKAFESGYGSHIYKGVSYNYGGYGGNNPMTFTSASDYMDKFLNDAYTNYKDIFNANSYEEYIRSLFPKERGYNPRDSNGILTSDSNKYNPDVSFNKYWNDAQGMLKRTNENIDEWIRQGYNK